MCWCVRHDRKRGCQLPEVDTIGPMKAAFTLVLFCPYSRTVVFENRAVTAANHCTEELPRRCTVVCELISMSDQDNIVTSTPVDTNYEYFDIYVLQISSFKAT